MGFIQVSDMHGHLLLLNVAYIVQIRNNGASGTTIKLADGAVLDAISDYDVLRRKLAPKG